MHEARGNRRTRKVLRGAEQRSTRLWRPATVRTPPWPTLRQPLQRRPRPHRPHAA